MKAKFVGVPLVAVYAFSLNGAEVKFGKASDKRQSVPERINQFFRDTD